MCLVWCNGNSTENGLTLTTKRWDENVSRTGKNSDRVSRSKGISQRVKRVVTKRQTEHIVGTHTIVKRINSMRDGVSE